MNMKTKNVFGFALMIALTGVLFTACKKDDDSDNNNATSTNYTKVATENATVEAAFNDAFRQVDQAVKENNVKGTNSCATVTITPLGTTYPKDAVIDYGTSCTGDDGVVRSGKILIHLTQLYIDSGSVTTVTFDNYYVNGRKITGTEIITNAGTNNSGHQVFSVTIQNGNLYSVDGTTSYNSTQQREWISGDSTLLDPTDDVYMITGSGSGVTTDGTSYTVIITTALKVTLSCAWIESGVIEITPQGSAVITINYGSGTCDNAATGSCSGYNFNIVMP
jgi:hypothetical protein